MTEGLTAGVGSGMVQVTRMARAVPGWFRFFCPGGAGVVMSRWGRGFRGLVLLLTTALCWSLLSGSAGSSPSAGGSAATAQPTPPRVGELPERRTQNSQTRRNENGSLTTTVFAGPVHYRAGD